MLSSQMCDKERHWLVIGNPESRRVSGFTDAVKRLGAGAVTTLPYRTLLSDGIPVAPEEGAIVRVESPGGDEFVAKGLLNLGIVGMEMRGSVPIHQESIDELVYGRGEILHPRQWMFGFAELLERLDENWAHAGVTWMMTPSAVRTCFDKLQCLELWESRHLPTPRRWNDIHTYHQLRDVIGRHHARLFIKLRYGYSAMGAVALEWRGDRVRAITTVEATWADGRPRLFVTKRPRILLKEFEIALLIDTLAMEDILVEEWLPKARQSGVPFDLRLVCIGGEVCHVVGRSRSSPFTNLNLDADRIQYEMVAETLGDAWPDVVSLASAAAKAIPDAFTLGIDLLPGPRGRSLALLEANAFGDYLPGLLYRNQTTYEAEVANWLSQAPSGTGVAI